MITVEGQLEVWLNDDELILADITGTYIPEQKETLIDPGFKAEIDDIIATNPVTGRIIKLTLEQEQEAEEILMENYHEAKSLSRSDI